jgi:hypothetical protein
MKRLIGNILIVAMLAVGVVSAFAAPHDPPLQQVAVKTSLMTGQCTHITDHSMMMKDHNGAMHMIKFSDPSVAQGIEKGDWVTVASDNGKATSVRKVSAYSPPAGSHKSM